MTNDPKGSIRVWKSKLFYEPDEVKRLEINDGISLALVIPSHLTKDVQAIYDRHGIKYPPALIESQRMRTEIKGLQFKKLGSIEGDTEHLRMFFEANNTDILKGYIQQAFAWLNKNKISFGEPNGKLCCIRKCLDEKGLEKLELTDF